jgi:solute carrier family 25 phosphate transporter 3
MHELAYKNMSAEEKANLSATKSLGINLGSGIVAGFAAAILSHPADTLLSQINKGHGPTGSMVHRLAVLGKEAGFRGLFAGLGPRMIMTAGLVSSQFLMYGTIKVSLLLCTRSSKASSSRKLADPRHLIFLQDALNASPGIEIHND